MHLLEPDEHSVAVAHHLLKAPGASAWSYRAVVCRRFLGDPLADALQLPASDSICGLAWAASAAQLWTIRLYSLLGRCAPTRRVLFWMHSHGLTLFHGRWAVASRPKRAGAAAGQIVDHKARSGCPFECVLTFISVVINSPPDHRNTAARVDEQYHALSWATDFFAVGHAGTGWLLRHSQSSMMQRHRW